MVGIELLERRIYVMSDVDCFLGLPSGTARRWIDGYSRGGGTYQPVIRRQHTGGDTVSWGEFVETSLLAEFRSRGVSLQRLRPAVQRLRDELEVPYPLAAQRTLLEVAGRELVMQVQESTHLAPELRLVVVRSGQLVLTAPTERFVKHASYTDGVVAELSLGDPLVRANPTRAGGRPAVRAVPAEVLAEGFRAGESAAALADLYDLGEAEVQAALRYEMRTARRATA